MKDWEKKKKSMFMPLGVVVVLFIKQANWGEAAPTPFTLLSTSKEGGQKKGPSYPNYSLPAGHRHLEEFREGNWVDDLGWLHKFTSILIRKNPFPPCNSAISLYLLIKNIGGKLFNTL